MSTFQRQMGARFGENLLKARERAGLSQEELGFRASLHRTQIGILERGARMPRLDTILKLAGSLSIPPGELFQGMVWIPGEMARGGFEVTDRPEPAQATDCSKTHEVMNGSTP
jgi:transcriptional regulator with XRE-family HTH domain